jgi:2-keto-4-pentenoate hydratase/2-oxohepta-3-ene-1,7-dioic acid hydratase in catechol pathway
MKIICIGRNYADHAKELKNDLPTEPMFFLKPDSAVLPAHNPFFIPEWTTDLHYEVELIVKINKLGKYIEPQFAHTYYTEIGLGIDFTARDLQDECKRKGHPWEKAKAFDGSAVVSKQFIDLTALGGDVANLHFRLEKNGVTVQTGHTADMIFHVDDLIAHVSKYMTLKIGDLMYTGTPAGVGPVAIGDTLTGYLADREMFRVNIR